MEFVFIFLNIIAPVFVLIGLGFWLHKVFQLDLYTLAKVNVYFLIPGFAFTNLYKTRFSFEIFLDVLLFFSLYLFILYVIVQGLSYLFHFDKGVRVVFTNNVLLFNAGNYGVPVNDLVFKHDPFAMSIQVIVMTFQNIFAYSFGIFSLKANKEGGRKALAGLLKMPVLYALVIGSTLNISSIPLPAFVMTSGGYIANAMIGIALLTLGAQVSQLSFKKNLASVYLSLLVRLIIGPIIGFCILSLLHYDGVLARALFIASSLPTAVNSAIIAQEYKNEPDLAAQVVLTSTIMSMLTVTAVIYFSDIIFS